MAHMYTVLYFWHWIRYIDEVGCPEVLLVNLYVAIREGQVLHLDLLHGSFPGDSGVQLG